MKMKTVQARKQRKRLASLSLHQHHSLLSTPLSKDLRKRFNRRNLPVRKGDKVRVTTGSFKGTEGEVMNVDLDKRKIYVDKVVSKKRDGTEVLRAMEPSNLMLIDIDIRDKRRQAVLARKVEKSVIDAEVKKEEARLKKEEEERKAKEEEKRKAEEAKKKEKEEKEKAGKGTKKAEKKKETKVSEKGINKKTKKDWISEK